MLGHINILVVEDDEQVRNAISKILTRTGHTILTAKDGVEAFDIYLSHPAEIEMIVTDYQMPLMNGSELIRRIRETGSRIPIHVVTGSIEDHEVAEATSTIHKPFGNQGLLESLGLLKEEV